MPFFSGDQTQLLDEYVPEDCYVGGTFDLVSGWAAKVFTRTGRPWRSRIAIARTSATGRAFCITVDLLAVTVKESAMRRNVLTRNSA